MPTPLIDIRPHIRDALDRRAPVVALESTLIAHGLPWPTNVETARDAERAVEVIGAVPATVAVLDGRPTIGLSGGEIEHLARARSRKASSRDLAAAVVQKATAATTVSATMRLAHLAGIRVFATGGIGGVHRAASVANPQAMGHGTFDVSSDLTELARTPMCVVCAGAKSILDLPATLEVLETYGVPVVGFRTRDFPAFYLPASGLPVSASVSDVQEAASLLHAHWTLGGAGVVLARPLPTESAVDARQFADALQEAERLAVSANISGTALTPFLLARLAELTGGKTLHANRALIVANAALAAQVALALCELS